ncbi:lactococcin 972 family bacteriocin [Streptomyces spongiae]|uniref:Lactococcin 972 family bacteriocin n=1 Tax=Streptomyces spongiae TaxID=565072 RepID=A0A5N8XF78_9ACTN|nr:lactococcin 972 family bacteriocin [Streptomyces spongiae]MPY58183.1 lactococcin 972 family bacteriocin [Streptomyces spongiae]
MRFKKPLQALVVSAAFVTAAAAPALAVTKEVGGGTWSYGTTSETVWSNYFHSSSKHGSSVRNGYGDEERSACVNADKWSYADLPAHPEETDYAYWRKC